MNFTRVLQTGTICPLDGDSISRHIIYESRILAYGLVREGFQGKQKEHLQIFGLLKIENISKFFEEKQETLMSLTAAKLLRLINFDNNNLELSSILREAMSNFLQRLDTNKLKDFIRMWTASTMVKQSREERLKFKC